MHKNNSKINILHLLSSLQIGGLEKLLVDFIKSNKINSTNVNFTVVIMNNKVDDNLKQELLSANCNVYFFNREKGHKHPKYLFRLLNIIKKNNIDIIHSHNYGSKSWSILCKLIKPGLKLVHTIHDSVIIKNLSKINLFIHKKFIDMNIAISKAIYQDCLSNNILKTIKIYNGVNTKNFVIKEKNPENKDILNIINIARITYYKKGQDILIKALKECKNKGMKFVCNFVGGVYEYDIESFEYLKDLVNQLNLTEDIYFLGSRDDITELLSKSDLFILPSRYEGLPISLLEAMAAKLPIIASDISGSNDLIQHEKNGLLFESENHIDLANKILDLYNNQEKMHQLAQKGFYFVQNFDISVMNKKYQNLYKTLIR